MKFGCNHQITFHHFFRSLNFVIFLAQLLLTLIDTGYLMNTSSDLDVILRLFWSLICSLNIVPFVSLAKKVGRHIVLLSASVYLRHKILSSVEIIKKKLLRLSIY